MDDTTVQSRRQHVKERELKMLEEFCLEEGVRPEFMRALLELERHYLGYERRRNFWPRFNDLFDREIAREEA